MTEKADAFFREVRGGVQRGRGLTHGWIGSQAMRGRWAGLSESEVLEEIRCAVPDRPLGEIRDAVRTAFQKVNVAPMEERKGWGGRRRRRPIQTQKVFKKRDLPKHDDDLRRFLAKYPDEIAAVDFWEISRPRLECPYTSPHNAAVLLWLMFGLDDLVYHGKVNTSDGSLWRAGDLAAAMDEGKVTPCRVSLNPLKDSARQPSGQSRVSVKDENVAARKWLLVEFDHLNLSDQARFWWGIIVEKIVPVLSLTYSGGKSLHAVIRVDGEEDADKIHREFIRWGADWQTGSASVRMRLPACPYEKGVAGQIAELWYLDGDV